MYLCNVTLAMSIEIVEKKINSILDRSENDELSHECSDFALMISSKYLPDLYAPKQTIISHLFTIYLQYILMFSCKYIYIYMFFLV